MLGIKFDMLASYFSSACIFARLNKIADTGPLGFVYWFLPSVIN